MRVYVAGKFEEKQAVRVAQRELSKFGHVITHDWTVEDATGLTGLDLHEYLADCADDDASGVEDSDAFLLIHNDKLRGGLVELGVALADPDRLICIVGAPSDDPCIFYRLPQVRHFATILEAVYFLNYVEAASHDADVEIERAYGHYGRPA